MHYDLGLCDEEYGRVECAENPFGAKLLPMSPAPCVRVVVEVGGKRHEELQGAVAEVSVRSCVDTKPLTGFDVRTASA